MKNDELRNKSFQAKDIKKLLGIDKNKLFYWSKTHQLLTPDIEEASGTGTRSKFSLKNLLELASIKHMVRSGLDLRAIEELKKGLDTFNPKGEKGFNIFTAVLTEYLYKETSLFIYRRGEDFFGNTLEQDYEIFLYTNIKTRSKKKLGYIPNNPEMSDEHIFSFRIDIGKIALNLMRKIGGE